MIRIGVLGAGAMGTIHAHAHRDILGVEVAAIYGRTEATTRALAAQVGATAITDHTRLLEDQTIDAVDICLLTGVHRHFVVPA